MTLYLYRFVLFLAATLAFVTLLDRGPENFLPNAGQECTELLRWVQTLLP